VLFPDSWSVYDRLAEAYLNNHNAVEIVRSLRVGRTGADSGGAAR
jgi:hypothetical protein